MSNLENAEVIEIKFSDLNEMLMRKTGNPERDEEILRRLEGALRKGIVLRVTDDDGKELHTFRGR